MECVEYPFWMNTAVGDTCLAVRHVLALDGLNTAAEGCTNGLTTHTGRLNMLLGINSKLTRKFFRQTRPFCKGVTRLLVSTSCCVECHVPRRRDAAMRGGEGREKARRKIHPEK